MASFGRPKDEIFLIFVYTLLVVSPVYCQVETIYCGKDNCYEVLGVTRESTKVEISKAYRKLARKFHPDRYKAPDAEEVFRKIAAAYETLKDDESRNDYNYMLDNPEYAYYHYYRYYRKRLTPKVDVRIVLAVTITVVSVLQVVLSLVQSFGTTGFRKRQSLPKLLLNQSFRPEMPKYLHKWHRYNEAITYAMQQPKFRNQAMKKIHDEGLMNGKVKNSKGKGKKSKEEKKQEEEKVLRDVVENSIDIRGGYSKPEVVDVLWIQLIMSPYTVGLYVYWWLRWTVKFWIKREEYGDEEKVYLTRKALGLSQTYWEAIEDYDRKDYLRKELWVPENLKEFKEQQEEEMRIQMAENNRHKMWRRWVKSGGPGRMTFMED